MMENSPMALSDSRVSRRWWMLVTVKSLSLVARITGNWKSLLVAKGVAFHDTLWIFAGCRPILRRQMSPFCGEYPVAVLKRNRTYVRVLYRKRGDLSREIQKIVGNG